MHSDKIKMLLKKITVLSALKIVFQRIYGDSQIDEMLKFLENKISKSSESDLIYQKIYDGNDDEGTKQKLEDTLQNICSTKPNSVKDHTPESLLELAKSFFFIGDRRVACELIWGSASLALRKISLDVGVEISSHEGKIRFAKALSPEIWHMMLEFQYCHSSFYSNRMDGKEISEALDSLQKFLGIMNGLWLTSERRKKLIGEKDRFV